MAATMEEVDDFIEHFGRKGMKWGVRKASDSTSSGGSSGKSGGISDKNKKRLKVAGGVAAAVAVAAGGYALNRALKNKGGTKLSDMQKVVDFNFDSHGIDMSTAVNSAFRMAGK